MIAAADFAAASAARRAIISRRRAFRCRHAMRLRDIFFH